MWTESILPPCAQRDRIHRLEEKIRRRVGVGSYITQKRLMEEMVGVAACSTGLAPPPPAAEWAVLFRAHHRARDRAWPSPNLAASHPPFLQVALGESEMFVMRALLAMAAGGDVEFKRERSVIQRVR